MSLVADQRATAAAGAALRSGRLERASAPFLVVGAPFSGATTLGWALAQHPGCVSLIGSDTAARVLAALRVLEEELLPLLGEDVLDPIHAALRRPETRPDAVGSVLSSALAAEIVGSGRPDGRPRRWVMAGQEPIERVGVIRALFPGVRLVHVVRDADVIAGHLRRAFERESNALAEGAAEAIAERTIRAAVAAERLVAPTQVIRLSYADLVDDPDAVVRACLGLAGERWHPRCAWPLRLLAASPGERGDDARIPPADRHHASGAVRRGSLPPFQRRLRQLLESVVPAGSTVLVASRGDDDLVRLRDRRGWHFPRGADGAWAGFYPADGKAAVAHLEDLRAAGAAYLVLPRPAFWWLDAYPELRGHLEAAAALVACDPELCAIWRLDHGTALALPPSLEARLRTPREPDNHEAFGLVHPTPPTRRRAALGGALWAITSYFNPAGYATKAANYRRFRCGLEAAGVPLLTVEVAFGDDPFALAPGDADLLVQLRGGDVLWQKERLLNLGLASLPDDCDKVAWLDADIVFSRADWASEAERLLRRHVVVQPFSHCVRLPRGAASCEAATLPFGSGEGELFHGIAWGIRAKGRLALASHARHGHTGFAWAARRSLLERYGLYDVNLLGNADTDIAHAMFGSREYWGLSKLGEPMRAHLRRWAEPFATEVAGSVAHVDGLVSHLWHGRPADRLYDRPLDVLHEFDPDAHLAVDANGLYRWADAPAEIRAWCESYFHVRREDG